MSTVGRVAVLGEQTAVLGYALAGAVVLPADDAPAVRAAWGALDAEIEVVVLTRRAADALGPDRTAGTRPLTVVMPS